MSNITSKGLARGAVGVGAGGLDLLLSLCREQGVAIHEREQVVRLRVGDNISDTISDSNTDQVDVGLTTSVSLENTEGKGGNVDASKAFTSVLDMLFDMKQTCQKGGKESKVRAREGGKEDVRDVELEVLVLREIFEPLHQKVERIISSTSVVHS